MLENNRLNLAPSKINRAVKYVNEIRKLYERKLIHPSFKELITCPFRKPSRGAIMLPNEYRQ